MKPIKLVSPGAPKGATWDQMRHDAITLHTIQGSQPLDNAVDAYVTLYTGLTAPGTIRTEEVEDYKPSPLLKNAIKSVGLDPNIPPSHIYTTTATVPSRGQSETVSWIVFSEPEAPVDEWEVFTESTGYGESLLLQSHVVAYAHLYDPRSLTLFNQEHTTTTA